MTNRINYTLSGYDTTVDWTKLDQIHNRKLLGMVAETAGIPPRTLAVVVTTGIDTGGRAAIHPGFAADVETWLDGTRLYAGQELDTTTTRLDGSAARYWDWPATWHPLELDGWNWHDLIDSTNPIMRIRQTLNDTHGGHVGARINHLFLRSRTKFELPPNSN